MKNHNSGYDIRQQNVFKPGNLVFQKQFLFLQALQLERVPAAALQQRIDGSIQIAVFLTEYCKSATLFQLRNFLKIVLFFTHRPADLLSFTPESPYPIQRHHGEV